MFQLQILHFWTKVFVEKKIDNFLTAQDLEEMNNCSLLSCSSSLYDATRYNLSESA